MTVLDTFRLDGRVAVVTGASSGLGLVAARALSEAGATLAIAGRRPEPLRRACRDLRSSGATVEAFETDVRALEDCEHLVRSSLEQFGRVDVLINNAGVGYASTALKDNPEDFSRLLDVNLVGSYRMAQAFGRACIEGGHGGSIINISSVLALSGGPLPQAAYSASKAGLLGMTRDLALQWSGRYHIRVNALAPGFFRSELTEGLLDTDAGRSAVIARTPLGRIGTASEIAGALLLLASDAGSFITGATLAVDGGWSLH